ncbi:unnamed protein product [Absidia cylindrospora]
MAEDKRKIATSMPSKQPKTVNGATYRKNDFLDFIKTELGDMNDRRLKECYEDFGRFLDRELVTMAEEHAIDLKTPWKKLKYIPTLKMEITKKKQDKVINDRMDLNKNNGQDLLHYELRVRWNNMRSRAMKNATTTPTPVSPIDDVDPLQAKFNKLVIGISDFKLAMESKKTSRHNEFIEELRKALVL